MLPGFILYTLLIIFIATTSSLKVKDESLEVNEEGKTATPKPNLRTDLLRLILKKGSLDVNRDQFLMFDRTGQRSQPKFVRTTEDVLKTKLMRSYKQTLMDLEHKIKLLEKLYSEKGSAMISVLEILNDIKRTYREMALIYDTIDNQRTVRPINIIRAYKRLHESNEMAKTLLAVFSGSKLADKMKKRQTWEDKIDYKISPMGIAWSYYDDSLG